MNGEEPRNAQYASSPPLPPYLARHIKLGFGAEDINALLVSIESSQNSQPSQTVHLPAELLLHILEYVPVDYVLDWRFVCRGFRDAIDGRILYHHLQRTELIGFMGARDAYPMSQMTDEEYEEAHLLRANFHHLECSHDEVSSTQQARPIWDASYAVFRINDDWYQTFWEIGGAALQNGDTIEDADPIWWVTFEKLQLWHPEAGFGTLRWCIKLDHVVLDLDIPLEATRKALDVHIDLRTKTIRVGWKAMLGRCLKTETALRRLMEQKETSEFTYSHAEDCLRAVRRQRLRSALDPENKVDRHLMWSLRLLRPLFGKPRHDHIATLENVEDTATSMLLVLRREAAMTDKQIAYLHQLNEDNRTMESEMQELERQFKDFKAHLSRLEYQISLPFPTSSDFSLPRNPIAWSDDIRVSIEERVGKWKSQKKVINQIQSLLIASNEALGIPEDSFDDLSSDI